MSGRGERVLWGMHPDYADGGPIKLAGGTLAETNRERVSWEGRGFDCEITREGQRPEYLDRLARREPRTLGDDLGDGDAATLEQAPSPRWPSVRERFEVWPDGSVWLRPSPFSSWRGPLVAIRCDGVEVW